MSLLTAETIQIICYWNCFCVWKKIQFLFKSKIVGFGDVLMLLSGVLCLVFCQKVLVMVLRLLAFVYKCVIDILLTLLILLMWKCYTNLVARWSFAGVVISWYCVFLQKFPILFLIRHRAWSKWKVRGFPWIWMRSATNFTRLRLLVFYWNSTAGYFEKRSKHAGKRISGAFFCYRISRIYLHSFIRFGTFFMWLPFWWRNSRLRLLPISVKGFHWAARWHTCQGISPPNFLGG